MQSLPNTPSLDGALSIQPQHGLDGWTELPYGFTYPPAWYTELARRGVDVAAMRTTPVPNSTQWRVESDGSLFCTGDQAHSWLRYNRPLRDFRLHVEWCFKREDRPLLYNSGVFVRNDPAGNRFTQIETGFDRRTAGFMFTKKFVDGQKTTVYGLRPDDDGGYRPFDPFQMDVPELIRPPGAWNSYDVEVVGRTIKLWTNGVHNSLFHCEVDEGYVGLEAEMHAVSFRRSEERR